MIKNIVGLVLAYVGLFLLSPASQAASLSLPALPPTCQYTQQTVTPLSGVYNIAVSTPVFAALKEGSGDTVVNIGVSCTSLDSPLSLGFNLTGTADWTGAGNDILATSLSGVGVALTFEPQYTGEMHSGCQASDMVRGGMMGNSAGGVGCILPASLRPLGVILTLRARLMKTGQNTPMDYSGVVSLPGSDLVVSVNREQIPVVPWMTPSVYTEPSCTLTTAKEQFIDFGQVKLPSDRSRAQALNVEPRVVDIGVRCQPLWNDNQNTYDVSVTFDGKVRRGADNVVATSRDDLGVSLLPVLGVSGEGVTLRKALPLIYEASRSDDAASFFARQFLVGLNYYPDSDESGGGAFESVVTYTITINH